jgi:hypothetical protein
MIWPFVSIVEPSGLLLCHSFLSSDKVYNDPLFGMNLFQFLHAVCKSFLPVGQMEITNNVRGVLKTLIDRNVIQ